MKYIISAFIWLICGITLLPFMMMYCLITLFHFEINKVDSLLDDLFSDIWYIIINKKDKLNTNVFMKIIENKNKKND